MIIVTGGLGSIGRAITALLVQRGYQVAVIDLEHGISVEGPVRNIGGIDLADEQAVAAAVSELGTRDAIDGLVNVAGGFTWETMTNCSLDTWDSMYRMNLRTAAAAIKASLSYIKRSRGSIVNVGAAAAMHDVAAGMAPYAASKAGIRVLTESLANELKMDGVRVNAVLPTIVNTAANRDSIPGADMSNWVQPEAIAEVIAFLLSDAAIAISGESIRLSFSNS